MNLPPKEKDRTMKPTLPTYLIKTLGDCRDSGNTYGSERETVQQFYTARRRVGLPEACGIDWHDNRPSVRFRSRTRQWDVDYEIHTWIDNNCRNAPDRLAVEQLTLRLKELTAGDKK